MSECLFCNADIAPDSTVCMQCGTDTEVGLNDRCHNCGSFLKRVGANTCPGCGAHQHGWRKYLTGTFSTALSTITALLSTLLALVIFLANNVDITRSPYALNVKAIEHHRLTLTFVNQNNEAARLTSAVLIAQITQGENSAIATVPINFSDPPQAIARSRAELNASITASGRHVEGTTTLVQELERSGEIVSCEIRYTVQASWFGISFESTEYGDVFPADRCRNTLIRAFG